MSDQATYLDPAEELSLKDLNREWQRFGVGGFYAACDHAERVRYCKWEGQTLDGRKHGREGVPAKPWEGASDGRYMVADGVIVDLADVIVTALSRAQLKATPRETNDQAIALQHTKILGHYRDKMAAELEREGELMAQWGLTSGVSVWQIGWERRVAKRYMDITVADLPPEVRQLVLDPTLEESAVAVIRTQYEAVTHLLNDKAIRAHVRSLRDKGVTSLPVERLVKNGPTLTALKVGEDIFFPPDTTDLQRARVIFRRDYLSETDLRSMCMADEWDEGWVEAVLERGKGKTSTWAAEGDMLRHGDAAYATREGDEPTVEVVWAYTRRVDENNVPSIWVVVYCPHVLTDKDTGDEIWARRYELGHAHGEYPFVLYRRENVSRTALASRGVPEVTDTLQDETKGHRDALRDRTNLETVPPFEVVGSRRPYVLGPGVMLQVQRKGEVSYMNPPNGSPTTAFALLERLQLEVDNYFGLMGPGVPPARWQARMQRTVGRFLRSMEEALRQMHQLVLQYARPEELQRILGSGPMVSQDEGDIVGGWDVTLRFDVRDLDTEYVTSKLDAVAKMILPFDSAGVIDRAKLVRLALATVDPSLAEQLVSDQASASAAMYDGIRNEVAQMALGNEARYVENDPAAGMKLQMVQDVMSKNPKYQALIQQDERFKACMDNYVKSLQMSLTQEQNKTIGRIGVKPVGAE